MKNAFIIWVACDLEHSLGIEFGMMISRDGANHAESDSASPRAMYFAMGRNTSLDCPAACRGGQMIKAKINAVTDKCFILCKHSKKSAEILIFAT